MSAEFESPLELKRKDYGLLAAYCLLLFGVCLVSGRPLSMHEAVLPQTARAMHADFDFIVPKNGDGPWLESPPLPQWISVALAIPFGHCDELWIVRLGNVLAATFVVLLVAWMSGLWFGRNAGLLSGFVMATTCQFTRYAWLAEDEIYLCAVVTAVIALFVKIEFDSQPSSANDPPVTRTGIIRQFFGTRSWLMLGFFVLLGMTNLVKGLIFGTVISLIPIATFLLWNSNPRRILNYCWLWGWLAFLGVAAFWPIAAWCRYPDVLDLWFFDLGGRVDGSYAANTEPLWYYPVNLLWMLVPWTFVVPIGMWLTARTAWQQRYSAERFLWCWAVFVPVVLSIPSGKHHHYMLHALAPWAILASFGLVHAKELLSRLPKTLQHPAWGLATLAAPASVAIILLWNKIPGPQWIPIAALICLPFVAVGLSFATVRCSPRFGATTLFLFFGLMYGVGHFYAGMYMDRHRHDAAFCQKVQRELVPDQPLVLDLNIHAHRGLLCQFYLDDQTVPLQNLTYLADDRIPDDEAYLLTQFRNRTELENYAAVEVVAQSEKTAREASMEDRLTLFKLDFRRESVERISSKNVRISPLQAMQRAAGPDLTTYR